jgi:hypothetical protein
VIVLLKVPCLLISVLAESFYGIGKGKKDVVGKRMKNRKNVWYFLFVLKEDNEG